jgi:hypothetical protein
MTDDIRLPPRYCPERPLPAYSYVPGMHPHPVSDPAGHSHLQPKLSTDTVVPLTPQSWKTNSTWLFAFDLFNHGYYWEAHEAWEELWHASQRSGPTADLLKGLIKLAAAGVKAREGRPDGVRRHARRARELFQQSVPQRQTGQFGLDLAGLRALSEQIDRRAPQCIDTSVQPVLSVFPPIELIMD